MAPKSAASLGAGCELDSPSDFLTRLEFQSLDQLPTQSQICVLGGVLATLDLDQLAAGLEIDRFMARPDSNELTPRPDTGEYPAGPITDELKARSDTSGTSLVMTVGHRLLAVVGKYV